MVRTFTNYKKQRVILSDSAYEHISEVHPEVTLDIIKVALEDPDEVRLSSYKKASELYYFRRMSSRYTCVVVKICSDGSFISTAMTTNKPKVGQAIYRKGK